MSPVKPGIYRRAFSWRLAKTGERITSDATEALAGLSTSDWVDIFEDFLIVSRRRKNNRTAMAKLQLHLIEELMFAQGAIKHYRAKQDELNAQAVGTPDDRLKTEQGFVERELFLHRAHANCLRAIGDGIAW